MCYINRISCVLSEGVKSFFNFRKEDAPDATTLLKFRRLLEQHGLNKLFFNAINRVMVETGHMLKGGTVADATIITASPSTKNVQKQRGDAVGKKGNEWHFTPEAGFPAVLWPHTPAQPSKGSPFHEGAY